MERLSPRVDKVVKLANSIARDYEQDYVGTEHVLLAIIEEGTGLGAKIMAEHGASKERVKAEIDKLVQASLEDTWVFGRLPGSPHFKNVVVSSSNQIDRSPCGAGTCARMAQLHARQELSLGEPFVQEGIIGTCFRGRLVQEAEVNGTPAVVPEVSARAFIIGHNNWLVDPDDPLRDGFAV